MTFTFDVLESRLLLTATLKKGTLSVTGADVNLDGTGIQGEVFEDANNNGRRDDNETLYQGVKNIKYTGTNGNDLVTIDGVVISGNIQIKTKGGNDEVYVGVEAPNEIGGHFKVNLGKGEDLFGGMNTTVARRISISGGPGNDDGFTMEDESFLDGRVRLGREGSADNHFVLPTTKDVPTGLVFPVGEVAVRKINGVPATVWTPVPLPGDLGEVELYSETQMMYSPVNSALLAALEPGNRPVRVTFEYTYEVLQTGEQFTEKVTVIVFGEMHRPW